MLWGGEGVGEEGVSRGRRRGRRRRRRGKCMVMKLREDSLSNFDTVPVPRGLISLWCPGCGRVW